MSALSLIVTLVLGATVLVGYTLVLVGMRQEDRCMSLGEVPPSRTAGLARRVTGCHVHGTRHTRASLSTALDVHPRVAMRILRHSQISMTMNVYAQTPSPEIRNALDRLNRSLGCGS
ncbi:hypothetical protein [Streptosporangium pseudovulgare]|uniref:Tyr recombinase domain-containing protein n=1 Tax=Streptosporangium pseudovulgare TaxID=35765 RepID=A0ABQ2R0Q8_9ACTN|nr:hypothetical protein [Streptosporangium pseudovulgare]GGQ04348.1 hypothetical protein GCM10010140_38070 [Streptosporangium pseudovulgare]